MANNTDSPTSLTTKKPQLTKRIGKKPMTIAILALTLIGMVVVYNIVTHTGSNIKGANGDEEANKLAPATKMGEELTHDLSKRPGQPGAPELSAPDDVGQLSQEREAKLKAAMEASTDVEPFTQKNSMMPQAQPGQAQNTNSNPSLNQYPSQNPSLPSGGIGGRTPAAGQPLPIVPSLAGDEVTTDQNMQAQKEAFLLKASQNQYAQYLDSTRKAALSPFELKVGTVIPCVLIDGINSDLPGEINAQVSEDVYDTRTGRYLLIPQGTKVFGKYDSHVAYGQNGLLVSWQRLTFPDASSLELAGMTGSDKSGYAGFRDQIDNHYGRLIGFGLATATFSSLFQISQKDNNSNNGTLTSSQIAAATTAQSMTQLGIDVTRRNLNIQPTIKIRPGYRFDIKIDRDVVFPGSYRR